MPCNSFSLSFSYTHTITCASLRYSSTHSPTCSLAHLRTNHASTHSLTLSIVPLQLFLSHAPPAHSLTHSLTHLPTRAHLRTNHASTQSLAFTHSHDHPLARLYATQVLDRLGAQKSGSLNAARKFLRMFRNGLLGRYTLDEPMLEQ